MVLFEMEKVDKKLNAMKANPRGDWRIEDMQSIAKSKGIDYRQPGTSHTTFSGHNGTCLMVPAHKPIHHIYVRRFVDFIEALGNEEAV